MVSNGSETADLNFGWYSMYQPLHEWVSWLMPSHVFLKKGSCILIWYPEIACKL